MDTPEILKQLRAIYTSNSDLVAEELIAIGAAIKQVERYESVLRAISKDEDETQQILGKALGYAWYKDDPKNFPTATEADGVCIGAHVTITIAMEAANLINRWRQGKFTVDEINNFCHNLHGTVTAAQFAEGCAAEQRRLYGCVPWADELGMWKRYASYLKCCAQSGEHKVMDFDGFKLKEIESGRP